jgi:hypothetical protein
VLAALPFGAAGFAVSGIFQQFTEKVPSLRGGFAGRHWER